MKDKIIKYLDQRLTTIKGLLLGDNCEVVGKIYEFQKKTIEQVTREVRNKSIKELDEFLIASIIKGHTFKKDEFIDLEGQDLKTNFSFVYGTTSILWDTWHYIIRLGYKK